jgi:predicted RNA-binding Zn-ribbon protein involved in translation (DUF1610 family)
MAKDVECPYCGAELEINHDDGYGLDEDRTYQQECSACGKNFVYTTSISIDHEAEKAACLNGGEHDYKRTNTYPRWAARDRCAMCGDEIPISREERLRLYNEDHAGVTTKTGRI